MKKVKCGKIVYFSGFEVHIHFFSAWGSKMLPEYFFLLLYEKNRGYEKCVFFIMAAFQRPKTAFLQVHTRSAPVLLHSQLVHNG